MLPLTPPKARHLLLLTVILAACGSTPAPGAAQGPASGSSSAVSSTVAVSAAPTTAPAASRPATTAASGGAASSQQPAAEKLTTVYNTISSAYLAFWMATDGGVFASNGLNVDGQVLSSATAAMAALVSGQAQIFQSSGPDVISAVVGGADLVVLGVMAPVYPYVLEVPPDIKSPADLKGKKLAIGSVGDTSDVRSGWACEKSGSNRTRT